MNIRKVKLNFNAKPKNKKIKYYMEGELQNFEECLSVDYTDSFEPDEKGVSFEDRYTSFLASPMKKGDEVDVQVLKEFISDLDNRADIDMNGQGDWETEEDENYLYFIGGAYFGKLAKALENLLTDEEK